MPGHNARARAEAQKSFPLLGQLILLNAAFWAGQLRGVESKVFTGSLHHARIKYLARAAKRNFRFATFPVYRHHSLPCMPPVVLMMIDAASALQQPFSECGAFHLLNSRLKAAASSELSSQMGKGVGPGIK